jgi:hypothetical protein
MLTFSQFKEIIESEIREYAFSFSEFEMLSEGERIPVKQIDPSDHPVPAHGVPRPSDEDRGGNHWKRVREGANRYFNASPEEQKKMREEAKKMFPNNLLGDEASNPKLAKSGEKIPEYRTKGLSLAPSTMSGVDVCPKASSECKAACLGSSAGRGHMGSVRDARVRRTNAYFSHPHLFYAKLDHELKNAKQTAHRNGQRLAARLNVLSDIPHEHIAPKLFEKHSDVSFYDYTKIAGRIGHKKQPKNYHLTLSSTGVNHPESNWKEVRRHLDRGGVSAMAFRVSSRDKNARLPSHVEDKETGKRYRVVDGDEHDHRHLDKKINGIGSEEGVIAGLKFKGGAPNIKRAGNFAVPIDKDGVARVDERK